MEITKEIIGKRCRARREELGLNQAEVARRMGVATTTVQRLEWGELNATTEVLLSYCGAVEMSPAVLFHGKLTTHEALKVMAEFVAEHDGVKAEDEKELLSLFARLDEPQRAHCMKILRTMADPLGDKPKKPRKANDV